MRIVLIRHGRPDEDHAARPHDPPLRDDGRKQAEAVASLLANEGITRVVASPLLRAHETALPLAARLGLPVRTTEGWAEADRHLGRYRSTETLHAQGPAEWQRFLDDPLRYLGVEPERFIGGVLAAYRRLIVEGPSDAHVAVYTHGLPINIVLSHILGLEGIVHFRPGYGSITRLHARDEQRVGIVSVNESGHHAWPRLPQP